MSINGVGMHEDHPTTRRGVATKAAGGEHAGRHLRRLVIDDIRVDSTYQRDCDVARVQRMGRDFDARRLGIITVNARAGILWCVDGQHRLALLRERGERQADAAVYEGLSQSEEAALFVLLNRGSKSVDAWGLFKAETVSGDPVVHDIIGIVNRSGFRIARETSHDNISAVQALRRIHALGGSALLGLTLETVRATWTGAQDARTGQIIEGLALFFHSFRGEPQYDAGHAQRTLDINAPVQVIRAAQEVAATRMAAGASAVYVAEAIRNLYNKPLRKSARRLGEVRRFKRTYVRKTPA